MQLHQKKLDLEAQFEQYKKEFEAEQNLSLKRKVAEISAQHKVERDREIEKAIESMEAEAQAGRKELQDAIRYKCCILDKDRDRSLQKLRHGLILKFKMTHLGLFSPPHTYRGVVSLSVCVSSWMSSGSILVLNISYILQTADVSSSEKELCVKEHM